MRISDWSSDVCSSDLAEAPMPLQLLATAVEERAIERALVVARHLLRDTARGWSVFHNSFRLFVIAQPRTRLGSIDADYSQRAYRCLAQLAKSAPPESSQRARKSVVKDKSGSVRVDL